MAEFPVRRYFFPNSVKRFFSSPSNWLQAPFNSTKTVLFCAIRTGRLFKEKGVGWEDGSIYSVKCWLPKHRGLDGTQLPRKKQTTAVCLCDDSMRGGLTQTSGQSA